MSVPCRNHCRRCGRHFYSLEAFDAHLSEEKISIPYTDRTASGRIVHGSTLVPICLVPDVDDEVANQFVGFAGYCDISHPPDVEDAAVFELTSRRHLVRSRQEKAAA